MASSITRRPLVQRMARAGLAAKGIAYLVLGALAFMAAFGLGDGGKQKLNNTGVFRWVSELPAGAVLLGLLIAGLFCYSLWRLAVAAAPYREELKKPSRRLRYAASGIAYLSLALTGVRVLGKSASGGDSQQAMAADLLQRPAGQWLLGLAALIFAANGIYQIWYALAGKYRDHVQSLDQQSRSGRLLIRLGAAGYLARGIVWLIIAWLLVQAAIHANAGEAGGTSKAFGFLEDMTMGSWILGAVGIGIVAYGLFNLARARWERL